MLEYARTDIEGLAPHLASLIRKALQAKYPSVPGTELLPNLGAYCDAEDRGELRLFSVKANSSLVGCAVLLLTMKLHPANCLIGILDTLYVLPEYRGKGVAKNLLFLVENSLRSEGVRALAAASNDPRIVRWLRMTGGYSYAETVMEKGL